MEIRFINIQNFKSIKNLRLECAKINLFIGEPNSGKSNILESLALLSFIRDGISEKESSIKDYIRLQSPADLFYDHDLNSSIQLYIANENLYNPDHFHINYNKNEFICLANKNMANHIESLREEVFRLKMNFSTHFALDGYFDLLTFKNVMYYLFRTLDKFNDPFPGYLQPPFGKNLLSVLNTNKPLQKMVSDIFKGKGLKLVLKPSQNEIEIAKEIDDVLYTYPYSLISDTLQRVVFYLSAIETNKNAVLVLEEPESHSFPFYTKYLAERIAMDETNQYFISTHNPYFLLSIVEKTAIKNVKVFITYFEDYQTKIKTIEGEQLAEILELGEDFFFNLDKYKES